MINFPPIYGDHKFAKKSNLESRRMLKFKYFFPFSSVAPISPLVELLWTQCYEDNAPLPNN